MTTRLTDRPTNQPTNRPASQPAKQASNDRVTTDAPTPQINQITALENLESAEDHFVILGLEQWFQRRRVDLDDALEACMVRRVPNESVCSSGGG